MNQLTIPKQKLLSEIDRLSKRHTSSYTWGKITPEELKKEVQGAKENHPGGLSLSKLAQLVEKHRCHKLGVDCDRALSILLSRSKDLQTQFQTT